jgi:hypothetical protein
LLQVCDVFEALTAIRPYKPPMAPQKAFEIMLKDQGAFEPALLSAFVNALGLYPPGNHVRLTNGEFGVVVASGREVDKPRIRITHDAACGAVAENDRQLVDLSDPSEPELAIAELVLEPDGLLT